MADELDDALLDEVLTSWAEGRVPDPVALAARHRAPRMEIERVIRAAANYRLSTLALRPERKSALQPGERVKDFEIVHFIGRGGMGEVYRARQLSLGGREVALKVLPAVLRTEASRVRFRRECELLSNLHHPSLAEVYGFGEERGLSFFAMRLIDGLDLRTVHGRLRSSGAGPAPVELRRTIARWIADVAEGLAVVHAAGLVHRDVKPSNVIVERLTGSSDEIPLGRAVLVDFGLVRPVELDAGSRTEGSPATLDYAPPEQLMGAELDQRADVFALGVTLHDLLTGRVPAERPRAALGLEPLARLIPGVDRDLAAIVARACDPDPRWRYANGAELGADLRAWLDGRAVSARRRPLHERLRRGFIERPARIAKGVLAVALVLAGAVTAAKLGQYVQAAERLLRAYDRSDLRAMLEPAEEFPNALASVLLEPETARLAKRCRSNAVDDVLRAVLEPLRRDDRSGALGVAATHLRVRGLEADPDVRWCFEGELRRALEEPGFDPALRSEVLRLLARLSFERPCETPEEMRANSDLRTFALRAWTNEELPELDRLYALSALSGLGAGEDLAPVFAWALEPPQAPERMRLGLSVARWILIRLRGGSDELASVDFERAAAALGPHLRAGLATHADDIREGDRHGLIAQATHHALIAFTQAERAASGKASRLVPVVPGDWIRNLERGGPHDYLLGWLLSVCGDPRARQRLLDGPWPAGSQLLDYWDWGYLTALAGDEAFLSAVRRRCLERSSTGPDSAERVAIFDGMAQATRAAISGGLPQAMKPDADTLLGAQPSGPAEVSPLATERSSEVQPESSLASWTFCATPPSTSGWSTGAWIRCCELRANEQGHPVLRFGAFGSSEVELRFRTEDEDLFAWSPSPVLVLDHVAAQRSPYPGHGLVFLAVVLNGFSVSSRMAVTGGEKVTDPARQEVAIPPHMLKPGDNVLTIRLHRDSMSTYRLVRAEVRSGSH